MCRIPTITLAIFVICLAHHTEATPPPEPTRLSDLVAEIAPDQERMSSYSSVTFSGDGSTLAAVGTRLLRPNVFSFKRQAELQLFDVADQPSLLRVIPIEGLRGCFGPDPDSPSDFLYVTGRGRHTIDVRTTRQAEPLASIEHKGFIPGKIVLDWPHRRMAVATQPPGDREADYHAQITVYDLTTAKPLAEFSMDNAYVRSLSFSSDTSRLAATGELYTKKLVEAQLDEGALSAEIETTELTGLLRVWELVSQKPQYERTFPEYEIYATTFSPDGNTLAIGYLDCTKKVTERVKYFGWELTYSDCIGCFEWWDISGNELRSLARHDIPAPLREKNEKLGNVQIECLQYSPDGTSLVAGMGSWARGGKWGAVHLIDTKTQSLKQVLLEKSPGIVRDVAFSPDGKTVVAGTGSGELYLWEVEKRSR